MKEYNQFVTSEHRNPDLQGVSSEELEKLANQDEDKAFLDFKRRIQQEPEQV